MAKKQSFIVNLPKGFDATDQAEFVDLVLDHIKTRTQNGVGVRRMGRGYQTFAFPGYTAEYKKAKGSSDVDLTLSGDMLEALEVIKKTKDTVEIGYKRSNTQAGKAEGNQLGSYGRAPDRKKARPFLGLTKAERDELENQVRG